MSSGFLNEKLMCPKANEEANQAIDNTKNEEILECHHCNKFGHMEDQCFDLHPFLHCGKTNNHLDRCQNKKKLLKQTIHYGWINPWQWNLTAKNFVSILQSS